MILNGSTRTPANMARRMKVNTIFISASFPSELAVRVCMFGVLVYVYADIYDDDKLSYV